jgi:hypothetical protein
MSMHLRSSIVVKESLQDVIAFFYHPSSLALWDRSVAEMRPGPGSTNTAGAQFDTIAPSGMIMTYEVIDLDPNGRSVKILLKNSKMFKKAVWHFQFEPEPVGTKVICHIHFALRPLYWFLYPVLFVNKSALLRDLKFFQLALDNFMKPKVE